MKSIRAAVTWGTRIQASSPGSMANVICSHFLTGLHLSRLAVPILPSGSTPHRVIWGDLAGGHITPRTLCFVTPLKH